jgi:hypothetical protein
VAHVMSSPHKPLHHLVSKREEGEAIHRTYLSQVANIICGMHVRPKGWLLGCLEEDGGCLMWVTVDGMMLQETWV